jgi:hypothetical protein
VKKLKIELNTAEISLLQYALTMYRSEVNDDLLYATINGNEVVAKEHRKELSRVDEMVAKLKEG